MQKKTGKPLKKIRSELLSISCALLLFISLFSFIALAEDTNVFDKNVTDDKISATLFSKIAEAPEAEKVPVIIQLKNQDIPFNNAKGKAQIESEQNNLITLLNDAKSSNKAQKIKSVHIVNAVAAEVTPGVIASLAKRPEVSIIESDDVISLVEDQKLSLKEINASNAVQGTSWGVDKIGAPAVWQQSITGRGIIVAVVDTGIDATHPDLDDLDDNPGTHDPKVVGWIDYVKGNTSPYDDHWHGTHVAGTISGTGANGMRTGVAPGTKLIGAKVFDQNGSGHESNVILAFEWAVNNGARIISFSGGAPHDDSFTIAVDKVVAAGVIPVIAAGNEGPTLNTIDCPGDEINSTTVGATDISDKIASFSSRGPVDLYGQPYTKPDVSAPGVSILSTVPVRYGYSYESVSGTSMATPYVTGTVALMLEKNPTLKPTEIKHIFESTAVDFGLPGKDNDYGSGRINAYEAVFYEEEQPAFPVANFSSNVTTGLTPLAVQFNDTSENATSLSWNFGDGANSTEQNPIHTYSSTGNYTVTLTVSNEVGADTETKTGYINVKTVSHKPVAAFSASSTSGNAPLEVAFTDRSSVSPTSWKWSFGDRTYSKARNPLHIYTRAGKYTVTLTAKNARDSSTKTMYRYITVSKGK